MAENNSITRIVIGLRNGQKIDFESSEKVLDYIRFIDFSSSKPDDLKGFISFKMTNGGVRFIAVNEIIFINVIPNEPKDDSTG